MKINEVVAEKSVSKAQQRFMGMVHAMQKGEKIKGASPELKKVARTMKKSDAKDFAKTKAKLFTYRGAGFLGSLMANHKYIWDEDCDTAWCDSVNIAFNPYFYRVKLIIK